MGRLCRRRRSGRRPIDRRQQFAGDLLGFLRAAEQNLIGFGIGNQVTAGPELASISPRTFSASAAVVYFSE